MQLSVKVHSIAKRIFKKCEIIENFRLNDLITNKHTETSVFGSKVHQRTKTVRHPT